jgi:hypothetical protein
MDDKTAVARVMQSGALAAGLMLASFSASASNIVLSGTSGSNAMDWTAQYLGSASGNVQTTATGSEGNTYSLAVPGQYTFTDTFDGPQTSPLVNSSGVAFESSGSPVGTYDFQDTYEFSLSTPASGDDLVVSLSLQLPPGYGAGSVYNISDLQFRLYKVPSGSTPGLTPPSGSTFVTKWTGLSGNDNGTPVSASFDDIASGTYFLDVAGRADGTLGGTYFGQLNLVSPVPLPAGLPLLLSGLAGLGVLVRQRRSVG